jgi:hypothetical protein
VWLAWLLLLLVSAPSGVIAFSGSQGIRPRNRAERPRRAGRSPRWAAARLASRIREGQRVRFGPDVSGVFPERTTHLSPARVGIRRHEPTAQTAQGGTARSSRSRRVRLDTAEVRREQNGSASVSAASHAPPPTARPRTSGGTRRHRDGCDGGSGAPFTPKCSRCRIRLCCKSRARSASRRPDPALPHRSRRAGPARSYDGTMTGEVRCGDSIRA